MSPVFKCLYYLQNGTHSILEIKRTDLSADADISDVYKWLWINKETLAISQLWFRSTDSSDDVEERFFDQGYLKFNATVGTFIEKFNSAQHQLENKSHETLPLALEVAIKDFLRDL